MLLASFLPSLLLIWIPIFFGLLFGVLSLPIVNLFFRRVEPIVFYLVSLTCLSFALFLGSFSGLISSVYINKAVFDYQILSAVLPSGIFLWYGFGPWFTPQFLHYWQFVFLILFIAMIFLFYMNFRYLRWKSRQVRLFQPTFQER